MDPEHQLVDSARRGDKAAAARIIGHFYERIYAFLRRLAGNDADAADLTQSTFRRVWQALPGFAGRSSVSSWIHGIAYHVYVDWRRADRRTEFRSDQWWADRPATGQTPDRLAARADLEAAVYDSVDQLDADLRETIHLHYYQELTIQETSFLKESRALIGFRILNRQQLSNGSVQLTVEFVPDAPPAHIPLHQINGQWKIGK